MTRLTLPFPLHPWIVAVALLVVVQAAQAATLDDCVRLRDDAARLSCYDAIAGRAANAATNPAPVAPASAAAAAAVTPATHSPAAASSAVAASAVKSVTGQADNIATPLPTPRSLLGESWALDADARDSRFNLRFHNPNYVTFRSSNSINQQPYSPTEGVSRATPSPLQADELKYQVSFKARLWETENRRLAVWLAYTQQSNWQILNEQLSRPFRETDYMPELMFALRPDLAIGDWRWRLLNLGVVHQSNGRADPLSRSWNRAYAQFGVENGNFAFYVKPWYRFRENAADDNNPDITNYLGHGELQAIYRSDSGYALTGTARFNGHTRKGAAEVEFSTPPLLGPLKGYLQVFSGYGESLIDYNWRQTTISVGLTLNDLL